MSKTEAPLTTNWPSKLFPTLSRCSCTHFLHEYGQCVHNPWLLPPSTHIFSFQHWSGSHHLQFLCIHVMWLTSLVAITRYLSYILFFILINSAAMNVFVKNKMFLPLDSSLGSISRERDDKVKEHEVFYSSCFILSDCFLERSSLLVERTLKVIKFSLPSSLNAWIPSTIFDATSNV